MGRKLYQVLKRCALRRETIKQACERGEANPMAVRKFLREALKKPYLKKRIVRKGRHLGFKYDGVVVFWDRVEEEGEEGKGKGGIYHV